MVGHLHRPASTEQSALRGPGGLSCRWSHTAPLPSIACHPWGCEGREAVRGPNSALLGPIQLEGGSLLVPLPTSKLLACPVIILNSALPCERTLLASLQNGSEVKRFHTYSILENILLWKFSDIHKGDPDLRVSTPSSSRALTHSHSLVRAKPPRSFISIVEQVPYLMPDHPRRYV